jgi:hypothetical protein
MYIENKNCKHSLYNEKTWIHGNQDTNLNDINLTIFLITIESSQLEFSLDAIHKLELPPGESIIINVIMNVSPTNKAYNEMRLRCTTPFFIQLDEDMELYPNAFNIIQKHTNNFNTDTNAFLHTFKLIDTCLGVGLPPIIDCLKVYNNNIMKQYQTFSGGEEAVSSVDSMWHKALSNTKYTQNATRTIIGFHGKHRTSFDLMIRHCKILSSIYDSRIKTNSGHLCKLLRSLHAGGNPNNISLYQSIITSHLLKQFNIIVDAKKANAYIRLINSYVPEHTLANTYNINNRIIISELATTVTTVNLELLSKMYNFEFVQTINHEQFFCIVGILCVITNNYAYSVDKYPYDIYNYFKNNLSQ